jgi:HK97 family phage portal protein
LNKLIDTAWNCLDLNSRVLASMPVYRMQSGQIVSPLSWMTNPDPDIYTSWQEFAKQLFWDYQMGEAFVLPMATGADGYQMRFRVVPPWLVNVEMRGGTREYTLGFTDVTEDILHIRYQSNTADARGHGPLEVAGARMTAAGMLQRYANKIAETGGTPMYWMEIDRTLNQAEAEDLLNRWVESRIRRAGEPALVTGKAKLNQAQSMSARDLTLLELAQFNESRIAVALGVPPFLAGLPSGGDSMTYSNVESLFSFHDRSSLKPTATAVMQAVSWKFLPRGQTIELNRDEYSRPSLKERAESYKILIEAGVMHPEEARTMERLYGPAPEPPQPAPQASPARPSMPMSAPSPAALSLTGGNNA